MSGQSGGGVASQPSARPATGLSAVIPARNEAPNVGAVVRAAKSAGLFEKVVVVSDGSTDGTAEAARQAGADRVVELSSGGGKGQALAAGLAEVQTPWVCFLDADLLGLRPAHLASLAEPVRGGRLAMSVGMWDRGQPWNFLAGLLPLVSGQRVLRREIFEDLPPRYRSGYKCETAMNWLCRCRRLTVGRVFLPGLKVRQKPSKVGWPAALASYLRMYLQVLAAMVELRLAGRERFRPSGGPGRRSADIIGLLKGR